jgi:hypothetical protein
MDIMEIKKKLTEALDKLSVTKIKVFDFDGTLVDTPLPDAGKEIHQQKTGKPWPHTGWWSKPESLDLDVFEMPVVQSVVKSYTEEKGKPDTLMVMMTGRLPKLSTEVETILRHKGLTFDKHIYNMGGATVDSKVKSLDKLLIEYPNVVDIEMWDDRVAHIPTFEAWGDKQKGAGRLTNFLVNLVPTSHHGE